MSLVLLKLSILNFLRYENFLPKVQKKIEQITSVVKDSDKTKLKEVENEVKEINNSYQKQVKNDYSLSYYSIWEELDHLKKIDEKISKKFSKYILKYRKQKQHN